MATYGFFGMTKHEYVCFGWTCRDTILCKCQRKQHQCTYSQQHFKLIHNLHFVCYNSSSHWNMRRDADRVEWEMKRGAYNRFTFLNNVNCFAANMP